MPARRGCCARPASRIPPTRARPQTFPWPNKSRPQGETCIPQTVVPDEHTILLQEGAKAVVQPRRDRVWRLRGRERGRGVGQHLRGHQVGRGVHRLRRRGGEQEARETFASLLQDEEDARKWREHQDRARRKGCLESGEREKPVKPRKAPAPRIPTPFIKNSKVPKPAK